MENRIQAEKSNSRQVLGLRCDTGTAARVKKSVYKMVKGTAVIYGSEGVRRNERIRGTAKTEL